MSSIGRYSGPWGDVESSSDSGADNNDSDVDSEQSLGHTRGLASPPRESGAFDFTTFLQNIATSSLDMMVEQYMRGNALDGLDLSAKDALDMLGAAGSTSSSATRQFEYPVHPPSGVPPRGFRSTSSIGEKELSLETHIAGPLVLVREDQTIYVKNPQTGIKNVVGHARKGKDFCYPLDPEQGTLSTDSINEDCNAKGTGLGFSSFVHCYAICLILSGCPTGIYEPVSGADAETDAGSFEITGANWQERDTSCNFVISKYALLSSCYPLCPELEHLFKLSWGEDSRDIKMYIGSAFDQGESPYRSVVLKLGDVTRELSWSQKEALVSCFKSWLSRQPAAVPPNDPQTGDVSGILDTLRAGSKVDSTGRQMLPCLFRVQCTNNLTDFKRMLDIQIRPYIARESIGSTYHTVPVDEYTIDDRLIQSQYEIDTPFKDNDRAQHAIFNQLLKYNFFQSIYLESELLPKINGNQGCFYSTSTRTGIAWKRVRHGSLIYYACYYSSEKPTDEKLYGRWVSRAGYGMAGKAFCSPTFKVNIRDCAFAAVLPYRVFASFAGTFAYSTNRERPAVVRALMTMIPMLSSSSWETTKLAGDQRFITTCSIAKTGDVDAMCRNATKRSSDKPLSSSCAAYLYQLHLSRARAFSTDQMQTPLFGLPIRFMALEKDLPLAMQWHIRGKEHATRCLLKMIKSATDEIANRAERVDHLEKQYSYLRECIDSGTSQAQFDEIMDSSPLEPSHNHVLFILLSFRASVPIRMKAGTRQHSTGMSINSMVTNHRMQASSNPHERGGATIYKGVRVHECMLKMLKEYKNPKCMHRLVSRMCRGRHIPNDYGVHQKDAKSSEREVSMMTAYMRPPQFFSESMCRIYCDSEDSDMMTDSNKAPTFVTVFSNVIEKSGVCSSEDKSFFCGYMQPDQIGLGVGAMAIDVGSTSLMASAALLLTDSSRAVYLPLDADPAVVPPELESVLVNREGHKTRGRVPMFKLHTHFMQGIRALAAALYATTVQKGLALIQKEMSPEITDIVLMTTSDDAVKGYIPVENPLFTKESTSNEIFYRSNDIIRRAMMKDNDRKRMVLGAVAEFNNMVVNRNGMMPQQFIHAHLAIQPLLGQSLAADLVAAVSGARSTLFWGDSLDVATAAYESNLILLRQKWLLTEQEMEHLHIIGVLPQSDAELIAGCGFRSRQVLGALYHSFPEDTKVDVMAGHVPLLKAITRISLTRKRKANKTKAPHIDQVGILMSEKSKTIVASEIYTQSLAGSYNRPAHPEDRARTKNRLLSLLYAEYDPISDEIYDRLKELSEPPIVIVEARPYSRHLLKPCTQGSSGSTPSRPEQSMVLARHTANINMSRLPTPEEAEIAGRTSEEVSQWLTLEQRRETKNGLSFLSPTGLPKFQFYDGEMLSKARMFSFSVSMEEGQEGISHYTHGVTQYPNFKLFRLSGLLFNLAKSKDASVPFGYAVEDQTIRFFVKPAGRPTFDFVVPKKGKRECIEVHGHIRVCYSRVILVDPLNPALFGIESYVAPRHIGGMAGDTVALINYGDYLQSSSSAAMSLASNVYRSLGCERPGYLRAHASSFPSFPNDATDIRCGRTTELLGHASVRKLRLKMPTDDDAVEHFVRIDLAGLQPRVVELTGNLNVDEGELV